MLRAASELGLTRMDIPFLLGNGRHRRPRLGEGRRLRAPLRLRPPLRARATGAIFVVLDESGVLLGALLGLLHALFAASALVNVLLPVVHPRMGTGFDAAGSSPLLEPPGFLLLNYGRQTPIVTVAAHIVYGAIVGGFASWAG